MKIKKAIPVKRVKIPCVIQLPEGRTCCSKRKTPNRKDDQWYCPKRKLFLEFDGVWYINKIDKPERSKILEKKEDNKTP